MHWSSRIDMAERLCYSIYTYTISCASFAVYLGCTPAAASCWEGEEMSSAMYTVKPNYIIAKNSTTMRSCDTNSDEVGCRGLTFIPTIVCNEALSIVSVWCLRFNGNWRWNVHLRYYSMELPRKKGRTNASGSSCPFKDIFMNVWNCRSYKTIAQCCIKL